MGTGSSSKIMQCQSHMAAAEVQKHLTQASLVLVVTSRLHTRHAVDGDVWTAIHVCTRHRLPTCASSEQCKAPRVINHQSAAGTKLTMHAARTPATTTAGVTAPTLLHAANHSTWGVPGCLASPYRSHTMLFIRHENKNKAINM
jgi:hypothetical protein